MSSITCNNFMQLDDASNLNNEEIPTLNNFPMGDSDSVLSDAPDDF